MIERITALHAAMLFTILLALGALCVWGLVGGALGRGPSRLYRSGLLIGQLLLMAEALLGVALLLVGLRPARPELHVLYALVAVATLPAARRYGRGRIPRQQLLMYALACLFLCAITLRAVETGRHAPPERPASGAQHPPKDGETPA